MSGLREALVALMDDLNTEVRSGQPQTPATTAAQDAIASRLHWPSMHWGTERVHPDAWPHIANAAAKGIAVHLATSLDDTLPTDAERLAAVLALCEERNDYGVLSISQVRAAAGGGS